MRSSTLWRGTGSGLRPTASVSPFWVRGSHGPERASGACRGLLRCTPPCKNCRRRRRFRPGSDSIISVTSARHDRLKVAEGRQLMQTRRLLNRWVLAVGCGVLVIAAGVSSAQAIGAHGSAPAGHAPGHQERRIPTTEQSHHVAGPYISSAAAERIALAVGREMGPGAQVVSASLLSVAEASEETGDQIALSFTGATREVWLVWMRGPVRILNCIQAGACPTRPDQLYYVPINAKTGVNAGMGWSRSYPHGPSVNG